MFFRKLSVYRQAEEADSSSPCRDADGKEKIAPLRLEGKRLEAKSCEGRLKREGAVLLFQAQ
jgi:hypothetical protein